MKPGASQLVYRAAAFTMERRRARRIRVGAVWHWRRTPKAFARPLSCLQAKQPADVDDGEGIIRPIASKSAIILHLGFPIHEVHCFYLKLVNKVLYGQKHCLLPRKNRHNQSQQVKTRTAQKGSNLAGNCRRKAGYFQVHTGKMQPLQIPANT